MIKIFFPILYLTVTGYLFAQDYSTGPMMVESLKSIVAGDDDLEFRMGNGYLPNHDFRRIEDLSGLWKFELGDDLEWAQPGFDDRHWEKIRVPSAWEDEGFPGYDGLAWYRTYFTISPQYQGKRIYLYLGYIDDVDEVYLNGHFIGFTGSFLPDINMADHILRRYLLPAEFLNIGAENVLAIRVYDHHLAGGIIRGKIGLYAIRDEPALDLNLSGYWKFKIGDNHRWKEREFVDQDWDQVIVPLFWEVQGYQNYDGFAWYRKKFKLPSSYKNERLILLLGIIDDLDETYLNGHLIGRTGRMDINGVDTNLENYWRELRTYSLPASYLRYDADNVIAVRVYDGRVKGGIYDGPVGIITRDKYMDWKGDVTKRFLKKILNYIIK